MEYKTPQENDFSMCFYFGGEGENGRREFHLQHRPAEGLGVETLVRLSQIGDFTEHGQDMHIKR